MHIEPGIVEPAKLILSYGTGAAAVTYAAKKAFDTVRERGGIALTLGGIATTALTFAFFELLPHFPVGVSELHFILGSTLLLIFGAGPAGLGLAAGLLAQAVFFAPSDLPQYGMNVTTLLAPLFVISEVANRIVPKSTRYVDISYKQALTLSASYQGSVVAWVAFWAIYGQEFGAESLAAIATFGAAYMLVVIVEPLVDLAVLASAKTVSSARKIGLFEPRLYRDA
ncbi:energy-coupling factor ABC transporter permease [Roseovarius sp. CAU 1744]|uniref:energy-coupling factor ABC transporter permease n=1 Tax=Roseovarius sp. CAU 1744 TaxID=3140368 RepID=UPI00325B179C